GQHPAGRTRAERIRFGPHPTAHSETTFWFARLPLRFGARARARSSLVPGLAVAAPAMGVVAFDDHPRVLGQLGCLEHLEQRLGQTVDEARLELRREPALEELDPDERYQRSTCREPPSGPSTRSSVLSGTWSSGTGASASMKVTPSAEYSLWCKPRLTTTTSPARSVVVASSTVISTSPSRMNITCSVSSCLCHGTCLPGAYWTRQSSTCSPPIACRRTPSTNSHESRPVQVRNGREAEACSGIDSEVRGAAVRRDGVDRQVLVEDHALAVAARFALLGEGEEDSVGRGRHLRDPHADRVVDRVRDRRRLGVVRHLADRLRAERPVLGRVLEDHVVQLGQVAQSGTEIR